MDLNTILRQKDMTKYRLAQLSGIPKTTIADLCAGRSSLDRCSFRTIRLLARALDCSMEDLAELEHDGKSCNDFTDGVPAATSHLECGLPPFLKESIGRMQAAWKRKERGEPDLHFDESYCELQSDINCAEINQEISPEQAWHLREKYLGLVKEDIACD